jgi:CheY-like chemotaxis protein
VEDDPVIRADLRLVLEDAGFAVRDARDGVEAVELARAHEPDVILLDLALPRLDGVEATRQILAERDVPIVALTGRSPGLAQEASDAGATSYVVKPFAQEEVVGALLDALALHADAAVAAARDESRRALAHLLVLPGYSPDGAEEMEWRTLVSGRVWGFSG